ncbi:MAG: beta-propeller domain-containing protein, partial [Actinomycetota bacterium]|nr:beta-propeller domain-containing protein [Actinomycetota bacterium]
VTNSALNCSQIAISEQSPTAQTTTWVATRNIHRNETTQGQLGIMSRADTMYATANSIHFTTTAWNSDVEWPQQPGPKTSVNSFSFNTNDTMYHLASGAIPGETIGQFALNEHGDELRIATTRNVDGISESAVTILTAGDNRTYNVLGEVGGLGLTERIYAVRYIGDLAYVVTFRETDPLYVVDLTDPTQPFAAGELKIPGYSSYLHPIADGKLLGIGQDADDRGRTLGTQLSLFDVSDSTNPLRLDKVDIGGASAAEYDHRAFLWWPAGEFTATADYDGTVTVTRMSELQTFAEPVELEHPMSEDCRWWNSTTRALVIGNQIVTIDATHIAKYDLETLRMTEASSYVESTETDSETGDNASISEPSMEPMC